MMDKFDISEHDKDFACFDPSKPQMQELLHRIVELQNLGSTALFVILMSANQNKPVTVCRACLEEARLHFHDLSSVIKELIDAGKLTK